MYIEHSRVAQAFSVVHSVLHNGCQSELMSAQGNDMLGLSQCHGTYS